MGKKINRPSVFDVEHELRIRESAVKPLNKRVENLRETTVNGEVRISSERARLITEFFRKSEAENVSPTVKRALSFKYLMENVSLPIEESQLIVGLRGTGIKEVPTYPEVCCHNLEDLDILNSREKNPYRVDEETRELYKEEIIPFWQGRTMRE